MAITLKLVDLLEVIKTPKKRRDALGSKIDDKELTAICDYIRVGGRVKTNDLELKFHMSKSAVLRRLDLLRERGVIERSPDNYYGYCDPAPAAPEGLHLHDNGFVTGILRAVEPMEEDEILATIEDVQVSLPSVLDGKRRELIGRDMVVACMDGQWRAAIQRRR